MADIPVAITRCCKKAPDTVIEEDAFVFKCPVCKKTVRICDAEKVKFTSANNFLAPYRAVERAVLEWNAKEETNG